MLTLPDRVGDMHETEKLIADFMHTPQRLAYYDGSLMVVVQQDPEASLLEWADAYIRFNQRYGHDWLALPRILGDRRVELIAGLQKLEWWNEEISHHAFGMNAGDLNELPLLNSLGIESCDSSAPVWRGLNGYHIRSTSDWPDIPFNPYADLSQVFEADSGSLQELYDLADHNLTEVLNRCQQKLEMPSPIKAVRSW